MSKPINKIKEITLTIVSTLTALACASPLFANDDLTLEEIIVTATRRAVSLQDVPISVVAMSGEKLDEFNIRNLEDLSIYIPNFSKGESGIGPVINIRGIASGAKPGFRTISGDLCR